MPVQFDEYERRADEVEWLPIRGSNAQKILSFLLAHPETGFTPSEIAEAVDVPVGSVGPTLQRLSEHGLVRHKEPYWAIEDDERIATYESVLRSMDALHDRYGDEGWADVDREAYEVDEAELEAWRERRTTDAERDE